MADTLKLNVEEEGQENGDQLGDSCHNPGERLIPACPGIVVGCGESDRNTDAL